MRHSYPGGTRAAVLFAAALTLLVALPQAAQAKKLQVVADKADVHLNADRSSPVIETLDRGAVMTLASAIKSRTNWYYVFFTSARTGRTRSGSRPCCEPTTEGSMRRSCAARARCRW